MRKKILPAAFVCLVACVAFTVCFLEATTKKEERKDADRKNQAVFINTARSALEKMNVPVADRRSSVEYAGNEVIVTFHPKKENALVALSFELIVGQARFEIQKYGDRDCSRRSPLYVPTRPASSKQNHASQKTIAKGGNTACCLKIGWS
jgi:hypothetical protein